MTRGWRALTVPEIAKLILWVAEGGYGRRAAGEPVPVREIQRYAREEWGVRLSWDDVRIIMWQLHDTPKLDFRYVPADDAFRWEPEKPEKPRKGLPSEAAIKVAVRKELRRWGIDPAELGRKQRSSGREFQEITSRSFGQNAGARNDVG